MVALAGGAGLLSRSVVIQGGIMRAWIIAAVGALLLAGCTTAAGGRAARTYSQAPRVIDVHGTVIVPGIHATRQNNDAQSPCWTRGNRPVFPSPDPMDDVKAGAQVVIADASGVTVATSVLSDGETVRASAEVDHPDCAFTFTASSVPVGKKFYGVKVGTHSQQVPESQLPAVTITLSP
jgi:hypothetical protein